MDPEEVELVADELNLSIDEAKLLLEQQRDFAVIVDLLHEDEDFLHAEMPSLPDGEYVVKYKDGKVPPHRLDTIEELFSAKHANASVKHVASKRSLKEAEERMKRLSDKLQEGGYAQATFALHGDTIKVVAKTIEGKNGEAERGGVGRLLTSRAAEIFGLSVEDDDLDGLEMHVMEDDGQDLVKKLQGSGTWGGKALFSDFYSTLCTTGFIVERTSDNKRGVATAG